MDLLAIGDDLSFVEQPGKRYTPSPSGMYSLTKTYMGDASQLSTFLSGKVKGFELESGFFIEEAEVSYGFHDATTISDGTTGDVAVTFHCVGTLASYASDTVLRGSPYAHSTVIYKVSTQRVYEVNYTTSMRSVEKTASSAPSGPADEGASGIGSAPDPIITSARPIMMLDVDNVWRKGDPIDPEAFAESTDYDVWNAYQGVDFVKTGTNLYRVTNTWIKAIKPIIPP